MTDAKQIAAGLSVEHRQALLRTTPKPDADGLCWFPLGAARGVPVELKQRTVIGHCLTPLGLAVRAILQEQADD